MITILRNAATILRANADLLGRNGYTVATLIATLVAVTNRTEYNGAGYAVRSLAARLILAADAIDDAVNGHRVNGNEISIPIGPVVNEDPRALYRVAADLIGVA